MTQPAGGFAREVHMASRNPREDSDLSYCEFQILLLPPTHLVGKLSLEVRSSAHHTPNQKGDFQQLLAIT